LETGSDITQVLNVCVLLPERQMITF